MMNAAINDACFEEGCLPPDQQFVLRSSFSRLMDLLIKVDAWLPGSVRTGARAAACEREETISFAFASPPTSVKPDEVTNKSFFVSFSPLITSALMCRCLDE